MLSKLFAKFQQANYWSLTKYLSQVRNLLMSRSNLERGPCSRGRSCHEAHCSTGELSGLWVVNRGIYGLRWLLSHVIFVYQPCLVGAWTISPWIYLSQIHLESGFAKTTICIYHGCHWRLFPSKGMGERSGWSRAGGVHHHNKEIAK